MKIVQNKSEVINNGEVRTMQNYDQLLGRVPDKMGVMATLYPELTTTNLVDKLRNKITNSKKGNGLQPLNSMVVEWEIDVNFIKTVRIVRDVAGSNIGMGFTPFNIVFEEKFYHKNDSISLEDRTQLFIIAPPRMINTKAWEYTVILISNNENAYVDSKQLTRGKQTRFQSNYQPEMSVRGYTKYSSNTERHRNFISRHRNGEGVSGDYLSNEKLYLSQTIRDKKGKENKCYYSMKTYEKAVFDSFMEARNKSLLFAQTNMTPEGRCLTQDENGADIPIGEGILPQIEKACNKFWYSRLSIRQFETILETMTNLATSNRGNTYAMVCNQKFYGDVQRLLRDDQRFRTDDAPFMYSMGKGGRVKVGIEFESYSFMGNTLIFMNDRAITTEFPEGGFAFFLDLGVDVKSGYPNLITATVEGKDLITQHFLGMGGKDGKTSEVAAMSTVHGSRFEVIGYDGSVVFAPYKAFVVRESI